MDVSVKRKKEIFTNYCLQFQQYPFLLLLPLKRSACGGCQWSQFGFLLLFLLQLMMMLMIRRWMACEWTQVSRRDEKSHIVMLLYKEEKSPVHHQQTVKMKNRSVKEDDEDKELFSRETNINIVSSTSFVSIFLSVANQQSHRVRGA